MIRILYILILGVVIISCQNSNSPQGPFFANGIKNGWADQNSIVVWTRLTQEKEAFFEGQPFIEISRDTMLFLAKNPDENTIYSSQIPAGYALKDMEGYCPGAPGEVRLKYHIKGQEEKTVRTEWTSVDPLKDFTHQWKLSGLAPGNHYQVKVFARANASGPVTDSISGQFYLPPQDNTIRPIKFCVVSCHDYHRRDDLQNGHKIYPSMAGLQPDFYVHTGDIEYMDKPTPYALTEALMRFKWNRLFSLPFQRDFFARHTSYFMKDDHDVGFDDSYPGRDYGAVSFERGLEIFDYEQFPVHPKHYKTIRWGKDLQIWIVEGRNYRNQNYLEDGPQKTIWGKEQKKWFFETVEASSATFKILITSSPILGPDRIRKNDNLSNATYAHEQSEILDFIKTQKNLFIVNGDRHWQYVTHIEGTSLWEFGCGAGADVHAGGWKQEDFRPEHQFLRVKGGFLSVFSHRSEGKAELQFLHHDVEGKPVNEVVFEVALP